MKARHIAGGYLMRLDRGEEVVEALTSFASQKKIQAGVLQGIGAIKNVTIGYFDTAAGRYRKRRIARTVEVVSLIGNISYLDGKPVIHPHVAVAGPDNRLLGGHLFSATVAVTLEIFIRVFPRRLNRKHDPAVGFNFWDL